MRTGDCTRNCRSSNYLSRFTCSCRRQHSPCALPARGSAAPPITPLRPSPTPSLTFIILSPIHLQLVDSISAKNSRNPPTLFFIRLRACRKARYKIIYIHLIYRNQEITNHFFFYFFFLLLLARVIVLYCNYLNNIHYFYSRCVSFRHETEEKIMLSELSNG